MDSNSKVDEILEHWKQELGEKAYKELGVDKAFASFAAAWNSIVDALRAGAPANKDECAKDKRVGGKSFYERYRETGCKIVSPTNIPLPMSRDLRIAFCCLEEGEGDGKAVGGG